MTPVLLRLLALWVWSLAAALCLFFLPVSRGMGVLLLLAVTLVMCIAMVKLSRRRSQAEQALWSALPEAAYRQPVVLCVDAGVHPDAEPLSILPQGSIIRISDSSDIQHCVRQLLQLRPDWGRQIIICLNLSPQQQHDSATLENALFGLRWQIALLRRETRQPLPMLIHVAVAGQMTLCDTPLWCVQLPGKEAQVWLDDAAPRGNKEWLQSGGSVAMQQQVLLNALDAWMRKQVLTVLTDAHSDVSAVMPAGTVMQLQPGEPGAEGASLWQAWLQQHTLIRRADSAKAADINFPEFILPLLPQGQGLTQRTRFMRLALNAFALAATFALCAVAWQNHQFIRQVAFDLNHYNRIAMTDYAPKQAAVSSLREDASQLDRFARQGAPLRLGLGLYQGSHLHGPVLQAISTWQPEPLRSPDLVNEPSPALVRLDAMSLFDSGQFSLKSGSNRMLVNSLLSIKAKPGWLIVVAGHTDNTGHEALNQTLSLRRAEAVRDWMRDTGDVDESCFAVQGFGQNRPVAGNDTAAGRAANRRVEISLVPQADACQVPGATLPPSQDDGGAHEEKE